jgi:hypothetical protein
MPALSRDPCAPFAPLSTSRGQWTAPLLRSAGGGQRLWLWLWLWRARARTAQRRAAPRRSQLRGERRCHLFPPAPPAIRRCVLCAVCCVLLCFSPRHATPRSQALRCGARFAACDQQCLCCRAVRVRALCFQPIHRLCLPLLPPLPSSLHVPSASASAPSSHPSPSAHSSASTTSPVCRSHIQRRRFCLTRPALALG